MTWLNRCRRAQKNNHYNPLEPRRMLAAGIEAPFPVTNYVVDYLRQDVYSQEYLAANTESGSLNQDRSELELVEIKHGLASTVTRFQQTIDGIPVVDAFVSTIQGPEGQFLLVHDQSFDGEAIGANPEAMISFEMAESIALEFANAESTFAPSRGELVFLPGQNNTAEQVWQMTVFGVTPQTHGDFLTFIDAESGKVIQQENRISHFTEGTGDVFYPNPYQTLGSGTGITDANDADSQGLTDQLINVTLEGLDEGTGLLRGEFVDMSSLNSTSLTDVDADESTRDYNYTRNDARFEQVVIYHTVDQLNRYFHVLGFDDDTGTANGIRDFATLANAHWYSADQSFYSTGDDAIHFGDGGVDDGEDGDIIAHEYGHAIQHDQNASWGGGEMGAMGEGFGDYLAASFFQTHGDAAFQANHAAAVGEWDATSYSGDTPPNLRRVDGNKMYPGDLGGGVHADGEIWSRALWDLNQAVGATVADQIILESHFMVPANSTMVTAAEMILAADVNINGGANEGAIRAAFEARGILQPIPGIGSVTLDAGVYSVGSTATITVIDANAAASIPVEVTSTNGDTETLILTRSGGSYTTTLTTLAGAAVSGDGQLQAALGDTFTVSYVDLNDGNGGSFTATDSASFANVTEYVAGDTPINITDNNTIQSTITIADMGELLDIEVELDITHTWDADLTGVLTAPNGEQISLFTRIGGSGDNYTGTIFDDDATDAIGSGTPPYTGVFRPQESFAALDRIEINGDWVLSITDSASQDTGTLNSWSLFITEVPAPIGAITDSDSTTDSVAENSAVGTSTGVTALATDPGDTVTYSLTNDAAGLFAIDSTSGIVTVNGALDYETATSHTIDVRASSSDGTMSDKSFTIAVSNLNDAVISSRQLYYDGSSFDGSTDFDAVATDKQFLVNGETATFANYSSYWAGLNGVVLELNDLNGTPTLANVGDYFEFRVGNDDTTGDWAAAPVPVDVVYESNVGSNGIDRVFLKWADNAIENTWLQVNVLSGNTTGLASADQFYFGNVIGETGNDSNNAIVNLLDLAGTRDNQSGFGSAAIINEFDFDRSGKVNLIDIAIVRQNQSGFSPVNLITPNSNSNKAFSVDKFFESRKQPVDQFSLGSLEADTDSDSDEKKLKDVAADSENALRLFGSNHAEQSPNVESDQATKIDFDVKQPTDSLVKLDEAFQGLGSF